MIAGGMRARAGSMSGRICIILGRFPCVDLWVGMGWAAVWAVDVWVACFALLYVSPACVWWSAWSGYWG